MTKPKPKLIASCKPGVHKVKIYRNSYVTVYINNRVRKMTYEPPDFQGFMSSIFQIAHNILQKNK